MEINLILLIKITIEFYCQGFIHSWNNYICVTNFSSHDLVIKITQEMFFHGFVLFAYKCHTSKTHMMHV
jgi:hypothetical protein